MNKGEKEQLVKTPPPYIRHHGMYSVDFRNGPVPDGAATWHRYGAHGGALDNLSSCHNKGYACGFSTAQTVVRFILAPMTIPGAWVMGFFIASFSIFAQMFAWDAIARLVGEFFGVMVLECMGKRKYYQKKSLYYDLAALEIQARNTGLVLEPGVQIL
eukprot:m.415080 g.415080  ORF g.415080 m.415080 type:complete len:158 (-) comp29526_c0_seq1:164-637(-)